MTASFVKGEVQPPAYRDFWFGMAFAYHVVTMVAVTGMYATGILQTTSSPDTDRNRVLTINGVSWQRQILQQASSSSTATEQNEQVEFDFSMIDTTRFFVAIITSLIVPPSLAFIAVRFMKSHGVQLIQLSLYFAIGFNIFTSILFVANGRGPAGISLFFLAAILWWYTKAIWHRIPFAAANLKAAVSCVQSNGGMALLALLKVPLLTAWVIMWSYVFSCVMNSPWMLSQEHDMIVTDDQINNTPSTHDSEGISGIGISAIMGLLLSFYWTSQVLHNVVHTTIAGNVGTWWFSPLEGQSCCSPGLTDSLRRSLTYSFGSICFGSLLAAIVQLLRNVVRNAAGNRRGGIVTCIAQCLFYWVDRLLQYFNKWAFIYVGLYGYCYLEAGKNVFTLFKNRGFTVIISDGLVGRMLGMVCFCIGLINALVTTVLALGADGVVVAVSALIGFFTGVIFSLMVANLLISATDTIIVLYAEAPSELHDNHPHLAQEMHDTWSQAWPDVFTRNSDPVVATPVV